MTATGLKSAIRNPQSAILAAAPAGFLSVDRVARLLGRSERTIQNDCAAKRLKAVQADGQWFIDPACRAEFKIVSGGDPAPSRVPHAAGDLLSDLSDRKRRDLLARHAMIEAYLASARDRARGDLGRFQQDWIAAWNALHPETAVSARTLQRLIRRYRSGGLAALVDRRRNPRDSGLSPDALDFAAGLALSESKPKLAGIYNQVLALAPSLGWTLPSRGHFLRRLKRYIDPKVWALGRDPRLYRQRMQLVLRRDWSRVAAMELWVADHRTLDVWVPRQADDGRWSWQRPWLTVMLDARSWKPVGWTLAWDSPDSNRVMGTFARAVREHGKPGWMYLDNGKDFRAKRFAGGRDGMGGRVGLVEGDAVEPILSVLGVQVVWADPYNARAKVVENWFGRAMAELFDRQWNTYCGRSTDARPEAVTKLDAAEAARGGLSIDAVRQAFADWVRDDYGRCECPVSASRGLSVERAFLSLRKPDFEAVMPAEETLAMLLLPTKPLTVRSTGIHLAEFGLTYLAPELEDLRGASGRDESRKVVVRYDPGDPSRVFVFERSGPFLCIARPYLERGVHPLARAGTPEDQEQLADALGAQKHAEKGVREQVRRLRSVAARFAPALARQWAAHAGLGLLDVSEPPANEAAAPPIIRLMGAADQAAQAGREDALERLRRVRQSRIAVGAEAMSENRDGTRTAPENLLDLLPVDPAAQAKESSHDYGSEPGGRNGA